MLKSKRQKDNNKNYAIKFGGLNKSIALALN